MNLTIISKDIVVKTFLLNMFCVGWLLCHRPKNERLWKTEVITECKRSQN